jgi:cephalosporin hydroxylase
MPTRSGRQGSQYVAELQPFIRLLQDRQVTSYLEIGARHGDTFFSVMTALPAGSLGVAVDLGGGPWGTPKSVAALRNAAADLRNRGYDVRVIFGNSQSKEVVDQVCASAESFGAVFIDGDHRYEGVKADWINYGGLAPIVGFHDIDGEGISSRQDRSMKVEVPRLWHEIKAEYATQEFICGVKDLRMGIGVVLK